MNLEGEWVGWKFTKINGVMVLVDPDGHHYSPGDVRKKWRQIDLANKLNVSQQAIIGRIRRGTLPTYDGVDESGRGYWYYSSIKEIIK